MKVVRSAQILCVAALACLAAPAAEAGQPGSSLRYPGKQAAYSTGYVGQPRSVSLLNQAEPEPIPDDGYDESFEGVSPWDDVGPGGCSDGCCGDCDGRCSTGCLGGLWYGGVDYLLFRPRYSQAVAAVRRQATFTESPLPGTSELTDTVIEYPFDYSSAFRVTGGYRLLDCGGDFQVSYWRMVNNSPQVIEGPADPFTDNPFIAGNLENNPGSGEFLRAETGVTANIIDVDFAKCISMGGPCNPCDTCFCPRWDVRFLAGARAADISRYNNNAVFTENLTDVSFGNINARFTGAGPRVGLQTRRYMGCNGLWSVYAKGTQAILIGDYRMTRSLFIPGGETAPPNQLTNQFNRYSRTIPVTDIELGLSWQAAPFTFVSVGYFWQCWWDLGQSENIQGTNFGALDTSNILGFDGLFVRGEMLF